MMSIQKQVLSLLISRFVYFFYWLCVFFLAGSWSNFQWCSSLDTFLSAAARYYDGWQRISCVLAWIFLWLMIFFGISTPRNKFNKKLPPWRKELERGALSSITNNTWFSILQVDLPLRSPQRHASTTPTKPIWFWACQVPKNSIYVCKKKNEKW